MIFTTKLTHYPFDALEKLVTACEAEFMSDEGVWDDEEEVAYPSSHLTFGMIRDARNSLNGLLGRDE